MMALSSAEKVRRFRERRKERREANLKTPEAPALLEVMRTPFFEWAEANNVFHYTSDLAIALNTAGLPTPQFSDDSPGKSFDGAIEGVHEQIGAASPYELAGNSLGRAEIMVASLIDAARHLAEAINSYKRAQISQARAEIDSSTDFSDANAREQAFKAVVSFAEMESQLFKEVRITLPQWKATGE